MRLTTKLNVVLLLLLLASTLLLTPGCGKKGSGACTDNVAPDGSTITGPTILGVPPAGGGGCYPNLTFTVKGPDGQPLDNICVEAYTNANIALHSVPGCTDAVANPQSTLVTQTDSSGNVVIELVTPPAATGDTFFVNVSSGAANFEANTPAVP